MKPSSKNDAKLSLITLNGFSKADSQTMVDDFNTSNRRKPMLTSVWFSKEMIVNMVNLLMKEKAWLDVDGVRIYYATNKQGKNTVLLVSTYNNGIDPQTGKTIHQDYFEHDVDDLLFTDGQTKYSLNGEICNDNSCGGGARLYEIDKDYNEDRNCNRDATHYINMKYATEMVWNFGTSVINTSCEWFDIRMFKDYLTTRFNGLRLYFGKRPNIDILYPGLDGFVIVTTEHWKEKGNEIQRRDYFDCDGHKLFDGADNGEQCHPTCFGVALKIG
ncbi:hypothetical protein [uncultured Mucilaginibacter sp.]|uniref:hypothetical protein n=1 Tax=uncultured Mucilaginibacter sp. TaxID=797541 RepID=UPI0025D13FC2|nr:hypothetical protein [uncultured Mucilaginibacter sp.]